MTLTLPWPPTVNRYWGTLPNGGRYLKKKGKEYQSITVAVAVSQGARGAFGKKRVRVEVEAHPPDRTRRDLDNVLKALLDALEKAQVFDDDSQIDDLRIRRGEVDRNGGHVVVTIGEIIGQEEYEC